MRMKRVIIYSWIICFTFLLTGCGKCEHEYDSGITTKESTCTEEGEKTFTCSLCGEVKVENVTKKEHIYKEKITKESTFDEEGEKTLTCESCGDSYTESISVIELGSENKKIYDQMIALCDNEEYMEALIIGRDAVEDAEQSKDKIDEFAKKVISDNYQYIQEKAQYAIENNNYEILDTLYYYNRGLNKEQIKIYKFFRDLQGVYRNSKNANDEVEIAGNILRIEDVVYPCEYGVETNEYEYGTKGYSTVISKPIFLFENGKIEMERVGFIKITYNDGSFYKYESDKGIELVEEEKRQRENERKQKEEIEAEKEEKAKQEYLANEPKIGMTSDEVKASNWGSPQKINKTTYEWGITEQWCYPNYKYIYFEDGIVTAIQE